MFLSSAVIEDDASMICNSLRGRDGFIQPIFYKRFDCFSKSHEMD